MILPAQRQRGVIRLAAGRRRLDRHRGHGLVGARALACIGEHLAMLFAADRRPGHHAAGGGGFAHVGLGRYAAL